MPLLRFSSYQQVVRQVEQLAPQNSAQVLQVEGSPDPELIESAFQATLRELGLGRVQVSDDEPGYSHEVWSGEPPAPLVSYRNDPAFQLLAYIESELNRPFPALPMLPYRPFAIQQPEGCYFGIVYSQWVADSVSIRILLREWFLRVFFPEKARHKLVDLPRPNSTKTLRLGWSPEQWVLAGADCHRWWRRSRSLTRFAPRQTDDHCVTLHPVGLKPGQADRLLLRTRAEGFTVNDLLIATLAASIGRDLPKITGTAWEGSGGRHVAIATSIDLRPYLSGDYSETFGSLLAYVPLICKVGSRNVLDMAQEVARETRVIKDSASIARKLLLPKLVAAAGRMRKSADLPPFFRRHVPVLGTVANVNLNRTWVATYHPKPIRQYLRVACPSPVVPLSLTVSTLGDDMTIILATQRSVLNDVTADRLAAGFAQSLHALVQ